MLLLLLMFRYEVAGSTSARLRGRLVGHSDAVWSIATHSTGAYLFSASADGYAGMWDLTTPLSSASAASSPQRLPMKQRFQLPLKDGSPTPVPTQVASLPQRLNQIAVGYNSGEVALFDIETGKVRIVFIGVAALARFDLCGQAVHVMLPRVDSAERPGIADMARCSPHPMHYRRMWRLSGCPRFSRIIGDRLH
jgi:hypothetical protein